VDKSASSITCPEPKREPLNLPNSTCLPSWLDEKFNLGNDFYACDTACEDLQDCSDCSSNSTCSILEKFFTLGDQDKDFKISTTECEFILLIASSTLTSYMNGYDTDWMSMSNGDKCSDLDLNNDLYIYPDEAIRIFQHFMVFHNETARDWEFQNRYKQVTCDHCEWYEKYSP